MGGLGVHMVGLRSGIAGCYLQVKLGYTTGFRIDTLNPEASSRVLLGAVFEADRRIHRRLGEVVLGMVSRRSVSEEELQKRNYTASCP